MVSDDVGVEHHRLTMFREGPVADYSVIHNDGFHENLTYGKTTHRVWFNGYTPDQTLDSDFATAQQQISLNDVRTKFNGRISEALRAATGNDLGNDPKPWWDWWLGYNEMYQPPYKPVVQTANTYSPISWRFIISCFPAGTPVETSTGPMPIEQIKSGDCVLAQDADSGELAYKAVMLKTVRPESPLIEVHLGEETLRAMRGHPFWVSGIGWQMAKELKAGQHLHTIGGPRLIDSVEERGAAECHNLVVADFNSYFVGTS